MAAMSILVGRDLASPLHIPRMPQRNEIVMEKNSITYSTESTGWWALFQPYDCFGEVRDHQRAARCAASYEAPAVACTGEVTERGAANS